MYDVQVNITHTTWIRCSNGTTIPNDILRSVRDFADMVSGDIVAEFTVRDRKYGTERYHYDYDNDVWHDTDGYELHEDGDWSEDVGWQWPKHLINYNYAEKLEIATAERDHAQLLAKEMGDQMVAEIHRLRDAVRTLAAACNDYRSAHDHYGGGSPESGRAWDKMRHASESAISEIPQGA